MSIAALCGRLMMVGVRGGTMDDPRTAEDVRACKAAGVGGIVLFAEDLSLGGEGPGSPDTDRADRNIHHPEQLRRLIEALRHELGAGLIVSIDQEGGRVARLRAERGFEPSVSAASFGRMDALSRRAHARAQGVQLAGLGVNLNLAPCADLAVNPDCPVIAGKDRAFSADPGVAAACAGLWVDEHARTGVRCCIKHFPGHGSARDDTHQGMADITGSYDEPAELGVFQALIDEHGAGVAVMTGHLIHRGIDANLPASLSRAHTGGLLRARLGFEGVVITDSLDMGAVTNRFSRADAMVLALDAGADILLDGANTPGRVRPGAALPMHRALVDAVESGGVAGGVAGGVERLERSVERVRRLFGSGTG